MFFNLLSKKENKTKKVALVLSGGGARGFFHIGVIKALKKLNIEITEIAGTSIGALIGAIYCYNPKANFDVLVNEFGVLDLMLLFKDKSEEKTIANTKLLISRFVKARKFSDFKIPLSFNATDIVGCKPIVFKTGNIFPGIIASMSVPGIMPPVRIKKMVLYDGGILSNAPVLNIKKNKSIVISDASYVMKYKSNIFDIFNGLTSISQNNNFINDMNKAKSSGKKVVLVKCDSDYSVLNFNKKAAKDLIDLGYKTTMSNKKKILRLAKSR